MKVILLEDVKGVGKKDEIIEASQGYAMNFLIPNKKGIAATPDNMEKLKRRKEKEAYDRTQEIKYANELKSELEKMTLRLEAKVGDKDKLFGTITSKEISEALEKEHKIKIEKKKIEIKNPIKTTGMYIVKLKLDREVSSTLRISVVGIK